MKKGSMTAGLWAWVLIPLLLWGCGDSGSGTSSSTTSGTVSGLTVASKVSVVDTNDSSSKVTPLVAGIDSIVLGSQHTTAGTDYATDETDVFVHDGSAEAFDMINEILCMMAQTKYDAMLNKGAYKAQVDLNKCESSADSASSAGQSSQNQTSGSTAPDYELWVVESSRADNSSPHIVKAWVHADAEEFMPEAMIFAKMTITEAKSSTNPYGIFTMYFVEHPVVNDVVDASTTLFKGFLKAEKDASSGKVLLKFATSGGFSTNGGDVSFNEAAVLDRAADGSTGSGSVSMNDTFMTENKSARYDIAFNETHFRRQDPNNTSDDLCFSRTSFDETVWRYGLYNTDGSRKDINAGFPIKKDDRYGWIGYYGLWFPEEVTVSNGDTVYKVSYSDSGEQATAYTVVKKEGKLRKHTKKTTTLSEIKGIPLDGWMEDTDNDTIPDANFRVKWDATTQEFKKFQKLNENNWVWENITEEAIDLSLIDFGELNFWSQAVGGQVRVPLTCSGWDQNTGKPICSAPTNTSTVIYFVEDIVYPGDGVPSTLRCYDNCPKATASGIDPNDPMNQNDYSPGFSGYDYTFDSTATDMILKESGSGDPLVMSSSGSGQYQWGVMSGPLFEPTTANLAALACDWDPNQTCGWKAWGALDVYYTWETGPNNWNQLTALTDANGTPLTFDPPLQVTYTHTQTDSSKSDFKYNGAKFFLEYSGFGNLWGIPGKCIDETGADIDCNENARWVPEFNIANGSEATSTSDGSTTYFVKALEKEQRMQKVANANCSGLTLTSYTLPDIADWQDPAIGSEPTVTNAPAVIGGVLQ